MSATIQVTDLDGTVITRHDFGVLTYGSHENLYPFRIANIGDSSLVIGTISISYPGIYPGFSAPNLSGTTIPAGNNNFTQVGIGSGVLDVDQTLQIPSNDPSQPIFYFPISGTGQGLTTFSSPPARDNTSVTSIFPTERAVQLILSDSPDTYFDNVSEVSKVELIYTDSNSRQQKRVVHTVDGTDLSGSVSWSPEARPGQWLLNRVKVKDSEGAEHTVGRTTIGTSSDITLA